MQEHGRKVIWATIAVAACLLAISFILSMKSGYNVFFRGGNQPNDGDVFWYIGLLMTKGYVPYRDIFDHKGPFLYFIQYIATPLGWEHGIWWMELIFTIAAVTVGYLFARRFNGRIASIFVVLLVFSTWRKWGYGNCAEEYSILFTLVSMYFFVDYFLNPSNWLNKERSIARSAVKSNTKFFDFRVCLIGICFACVFLMKANLCGLWIVFCVAIIFDCLKNNYLQQLLKFAVSFSVGLLIVVIPVAWYLLQKNAMADFLYDYFVFNSMYSSKMSGAGIRSQIKAILFFAQTKVYVLAFLIMIFKLLKRDASFKLDFIYTVYMVVALLLVTMSGQVYVKMGLALLPSLIYPMSILFPSMNCIREKCSNKKLATVAICTITAFLAIFVVYHSWSKQIIAANTYVDRYVNKPEIKGKNNHKTIRYIKSHTKASDKISVFGNRCWYYIFSDREPASKYIYLPDLRVDRTIMEEYFKDLETNKPRIIVLVRRYKGSNAWVADRMESFLQQNGYKRVIEGKEPVYFLAKGDIK